MRTAAFLLLGCLPALAQQECFTLRKHGKLAETRNCFSRLAASADPYLRAEGSWGLGQYQAAGDAFAAAVKSQPKNAHYRVRWGRLLLERFNQGDATTLFSEALEIDKAHAGALLGLALAAGDFDRKAVEFAEKAIAADPKLLEAHELLARLALEDGDAKKAAEHANRALAISPEALDAMAVLAASEWIDTEAGDGPPPAWIGRILKINPVYGEAYALAGEMLVLNRRYEEGIGLLHKAVEINPELWSARSELGINLMRLGRDEEARRQLELAYNNGFKDFATVNTLRLLDSYPKFEFFKRDGMVLKLHQKEAAALRPYFEAEIRRAMAAYEKKYGFKLSRPVQVEVYPDHEDFAVRTLGMPGLGALGVSFGYVVAMDSPSGRKKGTFHWASTLWHEMSHVYVLSATKHRVPRWFTEGLAVHEETAVSPDWGDRLDPEVIQAVRKKRLLPVSQLDRGFLRPSYPSQVVVSYFQAGRMCDFIAREWGEGKLVEMIRLFADRKTTPQAVTEALGISPEEFDKRFFAALDAEIRTTVDGFDKWREGMKQLAAAAKTGRHDEVLRDGPALRDLYPESVDHASAYQYIAEAWLAKGNKAEAAAELDRWAKMGGRDPVLIKKLAGLLEESGRKKEAAAALARLQYIDPLDEELHAKLGDLWLGQGNANAAIRAYSTVLALKPIDPAASHFNLARAYKAAAQVDNAKEHLLMALEAAPGYRPAQKLLLELNR